MKVKYEFIFPEGKTREFEVELDRPEIDTGNSGTLPEWTELQHCQCSNCPLDRTKNRYCPVAVDIAPIVNEFRHEHAFQKVTVRVQTEGRTYEKLTGLEEGLRSLLGLIMATSRCPILSELRPMAVHHMPFASSDEFILRTVSLYLLQQYFASRNQQEPDWELKGLVARNQQLQLVNQALWQRIHSICESDSNLKALLSFFSMASSVSFSLESQLQKLRTKLESGTG
ncbi:DUF6901 family protein [Mangrovitalea sediminis]|uniref:DUF6901 family protein n=1 Tax=Mangrovitalea sediminis TaxID=1982043 RepID=UPI000BE4E592|nr:hypothetical protein [Mangrovitalea sediminis]